jgi:hypothetical protein
VTLPSVEATYTERRSFDGKYIQEPRDPGEADEQTTALPGGVPVADREALLGRGVQSQTAARAVRGQHTFDPALGESVPASWSWRACLLLFAGALTLWLFSDLLCCNQFLIYFFFYND